MERTGVKSVAAWFALALIASCVGPERAGEGMSSSQINSLHTDDTALTDLAWLAPEANILRALTESPGECLRPAAGAAVQYSVNLGRAAFNSPLLFGGTAARGGLSCNSCHRDGRDNPDFFIAGLSRTPGTADVTSSVFSKTREDGVFNPLPIPTLTGIAGNASFGVTSPHPSIESFVGSAIVDEFQGAPPPDSIVAGLAEYVSRLDPAACPDQPQPRTAMRDVAAAESAIKTALIALDQNDQAAADFMIVSAQQILGRIHERYAGPELFGQRQSLEAIASELASARGVIDNDVERARHQLGGGLGDLDAISDALKKYQHHSLYDIEVLSAALAAGE